MQPEDLGIRGAVRADASGHAPEALPCRLPGGALAALASTGILLGGIGDIHLTPCLL